MEKVSKTESETNVEGADGIINTDKHPGTIEEDLNGEKDTGR